MSRALTATLTALAITAATLAGCGDSESVESDDSPSAGATSVQAAPSDPFDSGTLIRQWQQDAVAQIITVGNNRPDVDDRAVLAAIVAAHAESEWLVKTVGPPSRNLFGWTVGATDSAAPDSPAEITKAIHEFYDQTAKLAKTGEAPGNPAELAESAQTGDDSKDLDYYADRLCTGERPHKFCTPEKIRAGYEYSLAPATAAFDLMSP